MHSSWRKIVVGSSFFFGTCAVAILGYYLSGWELVDAIYMVIITTFGVGYGEVRPITEPSLKIFTMAVIIVGCSSLIYITGGFIQMVTEGEINRVLGTRRRTKGIDGLSGHAIVCGFGRVGRILAAELRKAGQSFVVVDANPQRVQEAEADGNLVVTGNATEEEILEHAGIARARVLATVLPDDAANVFITLTARELRPDIEIIGRAENISSERKLLRSGANRVVMPSAIGAAAISNLITNPSAGELLQGGDRHFGDALHHLGLRLREIELGEGSHLAGKTLAEADIGGIAKFLIVAVKHAGGEILRDPPPETIVEIGDKLYLLASERQLPKIVHRAAGEGIMQFRGQKH